MFGLGLGIMDQLLAGGGNIPIPLGISGTPGPAVVGSPYSFTPAASGGAGGNTFAYSGTSLAGNGMSFNPATGAITAATVTGAAGTISGTITVTDSASATANLPISITVSSSGSLLDTFDRTTGTYSFDSIVFPTFDRNS